MAAFFVLLEAACGLAHFVPLLVSSHGSFRRMSRHCSWVKAIEACLMRTAGVSEQRIVFPVRRSDGVLNLRFVSGKSALRKRRCSCSKDVFTERCLIN
ncbi:hypothetical protein BDY21DRAFT_199822 [Lineolata rhizophorae]|uniref:Secreted protein n=1 Tax=Lineolata rhizophorae TaxID=578093 RepID=A0A6A6P5J5_9PEZI|nr:hypothetical protein BDY21DRAFT_199822 [Lineolata rhizophorae]